MTQEELPKKEDYFAQLNTVEKLVFNRLVGERKVDDAYAEVHQEMEQLTITAGFTIDNIGDLMAGFRSDRQAEKDQEVERIMAECKGDPVPVQPVIPQLIGWVFKFPKNEGTRLVRNIRVERMDMFLSATSTTFPETPLKHTNGDMVTLRPKIFYQRSTVNTDEFALPYGVAFPHTEPGMFDAPDLTMADLEGYFRWSDLAMLQRGHLADFADFIFADGASVYNDLFFSGARLDYQTMHNPSMRLEQVNLKDSATSILVGQPESRTPFTLKAEPFIAATRNKKDGSSAGEKEVVQGSVAFVAGGAATANAVEEESESPPISAHLYPCPTIWEYSNEVATIAARQTGSNEPALMKTFRSSFYQRFNGANPEPILVESVTLTNRPRTLPVNSPANNDSSNNANKGCLGIALTIILLIICLLV
ncbi:hypothetical protein [Neolewinella agarilytica]|uniref:Uncharacterized protein n=1 Tax=Neolewinella agarilytica TaxID=478744 RepID=A0A1H9LUM4_9BACT|nr:hypothetical protein [Neolewinella agarilytica]SER14563.1 hypothetical protein SAMN05444359_12562 [Neolewinella agarilytica]